jgi:hypothetical protein
MMKKINLRVLKRVTKRLMSIERVYGTYVTRIACQRYASKNREEARILKEIDSKEKELDELRGLKGRRYK